LLFRKGSYRNNEVSVSGGSDKIKYFSSLGYTNQEGISVMGYLKRISGRMNISYEATKKLNVGANMSFSSVKQSTNTEGSAYLSPFYSVFNTVTGRDVPFNEDGSYAFDFPRKRRRHGAPTRPSSRGPTRACTGSTSGRPSSTSGPFSIRSRASCRRAAARLSAPREKAGDGRLRYPQSSGCPRRSSRRER
jgi:hypothetical protein